MKTAKPAAAEPDPNVLSALASLLEADQTQSNAEPKVQRARGVVFRSNPNDGQSPEAHRASMAVEGVATNALATLRFSESFTGNGSDLTDTFTSVRRVAEATKRGDHSDAEAILGAQVVSLNAIYTHLANRAADYIGSIDTFERLARLAFKAQAQCRATAESLAFIRNPGGAVFARQANIAHGPQQVNNGAAFARAEQPETGPIKLDEPKRIEVSHGPMDTGTARATSATDSRVATVGKVHRPAQRRR